MRIVVDPETGEQYEVLDDQLVGAEPYDYAGFRRMSMTVSREHRAAINAAEASGKKLAKATKEYRKQLALAVGRLKPQGATVAEVLAKGTDAVLEAKEEMDSAAAEDRAAMERIRLCRDDRGNALTMGAWSREANSDGWRAS